MIRYARATVRTAWDQWSAFWFESDGYEQIRMARLVVGLTLFACYLIRSIDLEFYYGGSALIPLASLDDVIGSPARFVGLLRLFDQPILLWTANLALLASLLALALSRRPRVATLSAGVALLIHLAFLHRNVTIAYGADMVGTTMLLYLAVADHRSRSVGLLARDFRSMLGSMAFRLAQAQVCIIYAYSGLAKVRGGEWWKGQAIWDVLSNSQLARWDFSWASHFPVLMVLATWSTILWELYFPVLIWLPRVRKAFLLFGIALHVGIAVTMNIPFFSAIMMCTYVMFLTHAELRSVEEFFRWPLTFLKVRRDTADRYSV